MNRSLFVAILVLLLLGSGSPKEYENATVAQDIQGAWQVTREQFDGEDVILNLRVMITLRGGTYTASYSDGRTIRGSYHLNTACKPAHLDWRVPPHGAFEAQTSFLIYQLNGYTLKIAGMTHSDDEQRPQGFNGQGIFVQTYKRVK